QASWQPPNVGTVSQYSVYRTTGESVAAGSATVLVATVPASDPRTVVDLTEHPEGQRFTYFVIATFTDATTSGPSNYVTITGVNDAPKAQADAAAVDEDGSVLIPVVADDIKSDDSANVGDLRVAQPR